MRAKDNTKQEAIVTERLIPARTFLCFSSAFTPLTITIKTATYNSAAIPIIRCFPSVMDKNQNAMAHSIRIRITSLTPRYLRVSTNSPFCSAAFFAR